MLTVANLPGTPAFSDPSLDGLACLLGSCCALLGAEKSSLPLGKGNAAFFWALFCASCMLKTKIIKNAYRRESAWHGGTFGPFAGRP